MVAAVAALLWADSPWREVYTALWDIPLGFRLGSYAFERDLDFWINEGLMTVFFPSSVLKFDARFIPVNLVRSAAPPCPWGPLWEGCWFQP